MKFKPAFIVPLDKNNGKSGDAIRTTPDDNSELATNANQDILPPGPSAPSQDNEDLLQKDPKITSLENSNLLNKENDNIDTPSNPELEVIKKKRKILNRDIKDKSGKTSKKLKLKATPDMQNIIGPRNQTESKNKKKNKNADNDSTATKKSIPNIEKKPKIPKKDGKSIFIKETKKESKKTTTVLPLSTEIKTTKISNVQKLDKAHFGEKELKRIKLSQPSKQISHKKKLLWLRERRDVGLWVQCSRNECKKWRYLADTSDPQDIPNNWFCENNPNTEYNNCDVKESQINITDEEDCIHAIYTAGSLVWARLSGYPWWPAMVDDCPDSEQFYWLDGFSDIPTHYNVVFFDSEPVTRAWIPLNSLKPFNKYCIEMDENAMKYEKRIQFAVESAKNAIPLNIKDRLKRFSFVARYKGKIVTPKKVRVGKKLPGSTTSDSDDDYTDDDSSNSITMEYNSDGASAETDSLKATMGQICGTQNEKVKTPVFDKIQSANLSAEYPTISANTAQSSIYPKMDEVGDSFPAEHNRVCLPSFSTLRKSSSREIDESPVLTTFTSPKVSSEAFNNDEVPNEENDMQFCANEAELHTLNFTLQTFPPNIGVLPETQMDQSEDALDVRVPTSQDALEKLDLKQFSHVSRESDDFDFD